MRWLWRGNGGGGLMGVAVEAALDAGRDFDRAAVGSAGRSAAPRRRGTSAGRAAAAKQLHSACNVVVAACRTSAPDAVLPPGLVARLEATAQGQAGGPGEAFAACSALSAVLTTGAKTRAAAQVRTARHVRGALGGLACPFWQPSKLKPTGVDATACQPPAPRPCSLDPGRSAPRPWRARSSAPTMHSQ